MTAGGWERNKFVGMQLHGRTLGIVGFGRIGHTLAQRAIAFGIRAMVAATRAWFTPQVNV